MMVHSCAAFNCTERGAKGDVSFHKFPNDPIMMEKWLLAIRRNNWVPSKSSRICSKHFTSDCFIQSGWSSQRSLAKDAIPSIFQFPDYLQISKKSRLLPTKRRIADFEEEKYVEIENPPIELSPSHDRTAPEPEPVQEPPKRHVQKRLAYPGDFKNDEIDFSDENTARRCIELLKKVIEEKNSQIKSLQQQNRRLSKKMDSMIDLIEQCVEIQNIRVNE